MARRLLRLVAAASILAFALTARTVTATYAATDESLTDASTASVEVTPTDPEEPTSDPLLPEPSPSESPSTEPVATEAPPSEPEPSTDPVEPVPSDPPPTLEPPPDTSPTESPAPTEAPPSDTVGITSTDPSPTATPPPDPPPPDPVAVAEIPPGASVEPAPTEAPPDATGLDVEPRESPVASEVIAPDVPDPLATGSEASSPPSAADHPAVAHDPHSDHPAITKGTASASTDRSRAEALPAGRDPAQTDVAPATTAVDLHPRRFADDLEEFDPAAAAGAGIAAGLAVTNRAPASVAVAIEFGRVGGGWAGSIVFNLWLRRQLRERRISQRQLAALSGVDHSTISRLLREDRRPSLSTATKLVKALKHVRGDEAEPEAADYFERLPEETVFPARRVEMALRADEQLDDDQVRRLMMIYLEARRRSERNGNGQARAAPARAAPSSRR